MPPKRFQKPKFQKVFPNFLKNLMGRGQFFDFAIRGPPRPVRDKILATVPRPTFSEKKNFSPKIDFLSSYENFPLAKRVYKMCAGAGYKWTKIQSPRFNFSEFKIKKNRVFPAKPMVLPKSLKTESVILTPQHFA